MIRTQCIRGYWNQTNTQISHTQSVVAKRGRTNRANVHTPYVKKSFKTQHGRIPIDPAILAAIGHRFIAKKTKNADADCLHCLCVQIYDGLQIDSTMPCMVPTVLTSSQTWSPLRLAAVGLKVIYVCVLHPFPIPLAHSPLLTLPVSSRRLHVFHLKRQYHHDQSRLSAGHGIGVQV